MFSNDCCSLGYNKICFHNDLGSLLQDNHRLSKHRRVLFVQSTSRNSTGTPLLDPPLSTVKTNLPGCLDPSPLLNTVICPERNKKRMLAVAVPVAVAMAVAVDLAVAVAMAVVVAMAVAVAVAVCVAVNLAVNLAVAVAVTKVLWPWPWQCGPCAT